VERPGIVALAPTRGPKPCVVLDVGANTDVKAASLAQFAVLGAAYARLMLSVPRPRVAVLSNGEEDSKGTELTREAHRLLSGAGPEADFEFAGYAEGRDFFGGELHVIVTDGFTGNVALKTSEGTTRFILDMLEAEVRSRFAAKVGVTLLKPALRALKRRLEPDETGGAPLLGIDGVAVICHGKATARALHNAIFAADRLHQAGLAPALTDAIARHQHLWSEGGESPEPKSATGVKR
jgi:glycerol-3-phosphate acyltransferase PlsX